MNDFLKSLTAFGMEGMNAEETVVEAYAGSECAEELMELDNLDNMTTAMESMADAIMENGLGAQTMALEAAGYSLDTASGFTGELSTEAIGNMVKRGYYEVKIQIKKALEKIWKLVLAIVDNLLGAEGRLKSYGKLFKKYKERLSKVHPKEGKDGEDREVTIRKWNDLGIKSQVGTLKELGGDWIKEITTAVKALDVKDKISNCIDAVFNINAKLLDTANSNVDRTREFVSGGLNTKITNLKAKLEQGTKDAKGYADALEAVEKEFNDYIKDDDTVENFKDSLKDLKDVDTDEMSIYDAKNELMDIATTLETECKKDLKFKKYLMSLRKAWDKKIDSWKLAPSGTAQSNNATDDIRRASSALVRIFGKVGSFITGYRLAVSAYYKAVASNLQGVLADMAKVIAKGTNIQK